MKRSRKIKEIVLSRNDLVFKTRPRNCEAVYRARRQSGFPTFISCQRQDPNVLPKRRQSHQGDKLCDVSTVPLVARWPVFLARGSDADGEPHYDVVSVCMYVSRWERGDALDAS